MLQESVACPAFGPGSVPRGTLDFGSSQAGFKVKSKSPQPGSSPPLWPGSPSSNLEKIAFGILQACFSIVFSFAFSIAIQQKLP